MQSYDFVLGNVSNRQIKWYTFFLQIYMAWPGMAFMNI